MIDINEFYEIKTERNKKNLVLIVFSKYESTREVAYGYFITKVLFFPTDVI